MNIKIKKSILDKIIKEESEKINKIITLKEERKSVLKSLNELYQEVDLDEEVESYKEIPDEVMSIIPDSEKEEFEDSIINKKENINEENVIEEGIGGIISDKIKNFVLSLFKNMTPEEISNIKKDINTKFGGMNFMQTYNLIKNTVKNSVPLQEVQMPTFRQIIKATLLALAVGGAGASASIAEKFSNDYAYVADKMDSIVGIGGVVIFIASIVTFLVMHLKDLDSKSPIK